MEGMVNVHEAVKLLRTQRPGLVSTLVSEETVVVMLWWGCGVVVVGLLWSCCGVVVGLLWGCCGVVVGLLWSCSDVVVGLLWSCRSCFVDVVLVLVTSDRDRSYGKTIV